MKGNDLDALFEKKISGAKTGRITAGVLIGALVLAILAGAAYGVSQILPRDSLAPDAPASQSPDAPATEDPEPGPEQLPATEPEQAPTQTANTTRLHRLTLTWETTEVPEDPIQIQIIRGSSIVTQLELSRDNNWSAAWEDDYPADKLFLLGDFPQGATASFVVEGDNFLLTGTYEPPTEEPDVPSETDDPETPGEPSEGAETGETGEPVDPDDLPQTGLLWWPVPLLALAGGASLGLSLRREKGDRAK